MGAFDSLNYLELVYAERHGLTQILRWFFSLSLGFPLNSFRTHMYKYWSGFCCSPILIFLVMFCFWFCVCSSSVCSCFMLAHTQVLCVVDFAPQSFFSRHFPILLVQPLETTYSARFRSFLTVV